MLASCKHYSTDDDAKPQADDAGAPTSPADAGASDEGSTQDAAATDAGVLGAPAQVFDDFERADDPAGGPLALVLTSKPPASVDASSCDGSPAADACSGTTVRFQHPGGSAAGTGDFLATKLPGNARRFRFDFGMHLVGDAAAAGEISQAQLVSVMLTNGRFIYIETRGGNLYLGDQYQIDANDPSSGFSNEESVLGKLDPSWARYQLYVDLDKGSAVVTREGTPFDPRQIRALISAESPAAIRIGTTYTDGQSSYEQLVDNLGLTIF